MQEQALRWIPLAVALTAGLAILLRNTQITKERRSPGQWLIFRLYRLMRLVWAIVRGIDMGYLRISPRAAAKRDRDRKRALAGQAR